MMKKKKFEPMSSTRIDSLVNAAKMGDLTAKKELLYEYKKDAGNLNRRNARLKEKGYGDLPDVQLYDYMVEESGSISGKLPTGYKHFENLDELGETLKYVSSALQTTPTISEITEISKDIANFIGQKRENISSDRIEYIFSDEFREQFNLHDMTPDQTVEFYKFLKSDSFQTYRDLDSAEVLENAADAIRKGASAEDFEQAYFDYLAGEEMDEIAAFERVKEKYTKVEPKKKVKKKKAVVNKQKRRKSRKSRKNRKKK